VRRFDELIDQAEAEWERMQLDDDASFSDHTWPSRWSTSVLNLLDRLSVSTNRFVVEFEKHAPARDGRMNVPVALGVLQAARDEYRNGFAVDYHLGVAGSVFSDLVAQAEYLLESEYDRAAAVLLGAALEEALRARARARELDPGSTRSLFPLIDGLAKCGDLNSFQVDRLKAVARIRNDAAHGGSFDFRPDEISAAMEDVKKLLGALLAGR
jgi:hypothetical protein